MSDFMESAKNFVNAAVSRTSWEAQKQLRLRGKQTEVEKLLEQRQQLLNELGIVAMTLYQQGKLSDAQLSRLCASILELDHDVKSHESQLQDIKNEPYPADQLGAQPMADYTPPPVTPNAPPPFSAPPNAGGAARPGPAPQGTVNCPNCGSPIRANALYCRTCGTKLR